ncbi:membrane-spanning 4-domains subfamily A member 10 [Gracilinanus agilis]|uniref:membrane-spanning 4-domains subfamily A member 10 n=1 Tax=Gracilinanus agilis TaxID=191870 RepID=UPI001CFCFFFB|nr:membrane-spanning 4-domains subfamily A member 10 [Gracilinanus agilis]
MAASGKDSNKGNYRARDAPVMPPSHLVSPAEKAPGVNRTPNTSHFGFFLQENTYYGLGWKTGPLTDLGIFQMVNALIHIIIGIYMVISAKNLHLVALKSWYPFWGAFAFFCSGALLMNMDKGIMKLKTLTIAANIVNCFCSLSGIFVFIKDLFLESSFDSPIWRPYPTSNVHLQRLEFTLLIFSSFEFLTFIYASVLLCRSQLSSEEMNNFSISELPPEIAVVPSAPPSYEEAIGQENFLPGPRSSPSCIDIKVA